MFKNIILIVAGVIGLYILNIKGQALDKESKAYVDEVTPKILTDLNKEKTLLNIGTVYGPKRLITLVRFI